MNWQHLKAILWLHWRLSLNRWKRSGPVNTVIMLAVAVLALIVSVSAFFGSFFVGVFAMRETEPDQLLLIWDGLVVAFLLFWMIGLVTELQRSESLSLDKLLHLPISLSGTFLLNYVASLFSVSLIVFLPLMAGLSIAMVVVKGPGMLVLFPLLAGFILMVTGVTYQFRGWLATLMVNKRRRRTIIALVTVGFALLVQIPNILNLTVFRKHRDQASQERSDELLQLQALRDAGAIDPQDYETQVAALQKQRDEKRKQRRQRLFRQVVDTAVVVNLVLPIGWYPYGARASAQGNVLPGLLGSLGATLIGAASLWRSYRATLRFYTGGYQSRKPRAQPTPIAEAKTAEAKPTLVPSFLEKTLGPISEHATAVALANFRSLMRAPEAKMMLLTPVFLLVIFGSLLYSGRGRELPELMRPLLGLGAIGLTMMGLVQLMQNLFGFDRNGFRVYVLTPAPRSDILLGKNLSVAPLAVGMCLISLTALQLAFPMQIAHLMATLVQVASVYIIFCMVGNLTSILAPIAIKAGSLKAAKPTSIGMLVQFACVMLFPWALIPTLLPLGIDLLLDHLGWRGMVPVYLILSILELGAVLWVYKHVLVAEGRLFHRREQKILDTVTAQVD